MDRGNEKETRHGERKEKNMKQLLFRLAMALMLMVPVCATAQKWNVGIEAGYLRNTLASKECEASARNGFKFGANVAHSLKNAITLESGLSYQRKGASISGENLSNRKIISIKFAEMNYLQIPLMIGYKVNLAGGLSIRPEVGAYYAVGIGGHSFVSGWDAFNQPYEVRVGTFGGEDTPAHRSSYRPCNRNDGGLSFALNVNFRHFTLKAEYDLGLANVDFYGNGKQRTFSISIGFWLF